VGARRASWLVAQSPPCQAGRETVIKKRFSEVLDAIGKDGVVVWT
jgi:hypothetical protein